MKIQFGHFLKLSYDVFKPQKQKRLTDASIESEIKPYFVEIIEHLESIGETEAMNPHNVASAAWRRYNQFPSPFTENP